MTTETFSNDTINNLVKLAIEKGNVDMLQMLIVKKMITLEECIKQSTEKGNTELIMHLMKDNKETAKPTVEAAKPTENSKTSTKRPMDLKGYNIFGLSRFTTKLIFDICNQPNQAFNDLKAGIVSLEEINYQDCNMKWNSLHYVCYYMKNISKADLLVKELLANGVNFNAESNGGVTPLWFAIIKETNSTIEQDNIVKTLLATPNIDTKVTGKCVFTLAIQDYSTTMSGSLLSILFEYEKNLNIKTIVQYMSSKDSGKILCAYLRAHRTANIQISNCGNLSNIQLEALASILADKAVVYSLDTK